MKLHYSSIKLFLLLAVITISCTAFQCDDDFGNCSTFVPKDVLVKNAILQSEPNFFSSQSNQITPINKTSLRLRYEVTPADSIPVSFDPTACTVLVPKDKLTAIRIYNAKGISSLALNTEMSSYFRVKNNTDDIDNKYYLTIDEALPFINNQAVSGNAIIELVKPITISAEEMVVFRMELDYLRDNQPITITTYTDQFKVKP
jgi:hypothetical protein